ncbi:MAG: carboxyl-terminal processing protease [Glaciecola sp.]|uniref:S41 family peptidase n=1 Tax=Congregibacter sp. TaxID=2744308 RepID=UPI0039E3D7E4
MLSRAFAKHAGWLCAFLLSACGGGGNSGSITQPSPAPTVVDSCGVESQKEFVIAVAQDWYLWFDEMAVVNPASFNTADSYLSALTAPLAEDFRDLGFSYLTTVAEDEANFTSRAFVGFGFRFAIDDDGRYLISDAFEGAPAFRAGFARGTQILAVDAGDGYVTMRQYEEQDASLDDIFGGSVEGLERGFQLQVGSETVELIVAKENLDVPPLAAAPRALERPGLAPVGYIHLRSFTLSARPALNDAFAELAGQGISDFVVDLRYNGGGLVDIADLFLDLLGGAVANGDVAYQVKHNDKRVAENISYVFDDQPASASPLRIAFITSEATASASELLIHSLEPFVEIVLVGSDTTGKAVGQYAFDQRGCDTRLRLVSFESVNGEGFGGYYTGLIDTGRFTLCELEDDYSGAFGSTDDVLTAGALAWLNEGTCPTRPNSSSTASNGIRRAAFPITGRDRPDRRSSWVQ